MLNVKTLTDTMSRMELPQLQQYAALHKNDPYIVTLALSIANQKKQMKAGQAGQAGMMPQPKVADQQIAQMVAPAPQQQMLPEDTGIGQLPAQNMQRMAEGGIVAFEDGGKVPGYAGGVFTGNPEDYIYTGGIGQPYYVSAPYNPRNPSPLTPLKGQKFASKEEAIAAIKALSSPAAAAPAASRPSGPFDYPVGAKVAPPVPVAAKPAAPAAAPATPAAAPVAAKPVAPAVTAAPVDLMSGVKALKTEPMTAEEAVAASNKFGTGSELTTGINQLRSDTIKSNEDLSKAYEKGLAGLAKPGEQAEARLKQREAEDVVSKADAKAMAIFKAGLGMMAGTSQNAFENIGKGAMAGLEDYSASIKDFRKLAIERDKAYAEIEAARNAAARDDFKTSVGLQEKATDRLARVNEKGIDITATLFKTNKDAASNIWNTSTTLASANARSANDVQMQANKSVFEQSAQAQRDAANNAAALQRTQIQANAPTGIERILSNPKLLAAYKDYATAGTESKGINAFALEALKDPSLLPRLEAGSAQDRQLAASIKQHMQGMMINPVNVPGGATNLRP